MNLLEFEAWAESVRGRLEEHYGKNFEINRDAELGGTTVPVVFSMRKRQPKTYLGFAMKNAELGPEACEFALVLQEREFCADTLERICGLAECAEREYINRGKDHGFAFISVIVLCESADKNAASSLKKYKNRKEYPDGGWMLARAVVFYRDGLQVCSRDGADLRNMLKKSVMEGSQI